MSQMPQLSACPSCEEPLESGDRFCGACGYDLSAVPPRPDDHPTVALNGAVRVDSDGYCENCGHAQPRERDHMEQECGPLAAVSDRGLRHHRNEDAFGIGTATLPD